jgi:hypothetical protein
VGLDIDVIGAKNLFGTLTRQVLHDIGKLATAVIALSRISLSIFIREHGTCGFQHSYADKIFGRDQFQTLMLAVGFIGYGLGNLRIGFRERAGHPRILHDKNLKAFSAQ